VHPSAPPPITTKEAAEEAVGEAVKEAVKEAAEEAAEKVMVVGGGGGGRGGGRGGGGGGGGSVERRGDWLETAVAVAWGEMLHHVVTAILRCHFYGGCYVLRVPGVVMERVFGFLPLGMLGGLCAVCSEWYAHASGDVLWPSLNIARFCSLDPPPPITLRPQALDAVPGGAGPTTHALAVPAPAPTFYVRAEGGALITGMADKAGIAGAQQGNNGGGRRSSDEFRRSSGGGFGEELAAVTDIFAGNRGRPTTSPAAPRGTLGTLKRNLQHLQSLQPQPMQQQQQQQQQQQALPELPSLAHRTAARPTSGADGVNSRSSSGGGGAVIGAGGAAGGATAGLHAKGSIAPLPTTGTALPPCRGSEGTVFSLRGDRHRGGRPARRCHDSGHTPLLRCRAAVTAATAVSSAVSAVSAASPRDASEARSEAGRTLGTAASDEAIRDLGNGGHGGPRSGLAAVAATAAAAAEAAFRGAPFNLLLAASSSVCQRGSGGGGGGGGGSGRRGGGRSVGGNKYDDVLFGGMDFRHESRRTLYGRESAHGSGSQGGGHGTGHGHGGVWSDALDAQLDASPLPPHRASLDAAAAAQANSEAAAPAAPDAPAWTVLPDGQPEQGGVGPLGELGAGLFDSGGVMGPGAGGGGGASAPGFVVSSNRKGRNSRRGSSGGGGGGGSSISSRALPETGGATGGASQRGRGDGAVPGASSTSASGVAGRPGSNGRSGSGIPGSGAAPSAARLAPGPHSFQSLGPRPALARSVGGGGGGGGVGGRRNSSGGHSDYRANGGGSDDMAALRDFFEMSLDSGFRGLRSDELTRCIESDDDTSFASGFTSCVGCASDAGRSSFGGTNASDAAIRRPDDDDDDDDDADDEHDGRLLMRGQLPTGEGPGAASAAARVSVAGAAATAPRAAAASRPRPLAVSNRTRVVLSFT